MALIKRKPKKSTDPRKELFKKMEDLKLKEKAIKEEYKELEEKALGYGDNVVKTEHGKFTYSSRTTYECTDKCGIVKLMGVNTYKEHSSISKTGVIKGIGEKGFEKAIEKGLMKVKKISTFYTFKENK
jgi:hypothetical protein